MNEPTATYLDLFYAIDFEKIIDHPNILIAANFWDNDRYKAAKVCYKVMRHIDDLIDNYKTAHPVISKAEQKQLTIDVESWLETLKNGSNEAFPSRETFKIPVWPMEAFAKSMSYDISQEIQPYLCSRSQLSLDIIFNLYLMVYERIDASNSNFTAEGLNPTAEEVKKRVHETILAFQPSYL